MRPLESASVSGATASSTARNVSFYKTACGLPGSCRRHRAGLRCAATAGVCGLPQGEAPAVTGARRRAAAGRGALAFCALVAACSGTPTFPPAAPSTGHRAAPTDRDFRASDLAKSDIDAAAEVHLRECLASARLLMEKLY